MSAEAVLLVENSDGAVVGVRFPSSAAARDWDDAHPGIECVGCIPLVSRREAARA